ncbi:MAG: helix-turn-helix domain-containing protein [Planctomycetota bacterium]
MAKEISPELRRRIFDAALAAERDYSADLTVAALAEYTGLSDKHFQRCFREVIGESPKKYIRRIRLQTAAYLLKWSDITVTEVAMTAGFETHPGFNKAFVKAYGQSPQDFRTSHNVTPYLHFKRDSTKPLELDDLEAVKLLVRMEQMPSTRIATMRHIGPVEKTAEIWPQMIEWTKKHDLFNDQTQVMGIHNDYWDSNAEDRYRYDAAVVVPDDFEPDDAVSTYTIPSGLVAMTEFSGSLSEMDAAWRRLVDQWLPISGHLTRTAYAFDRYPIELVTGGILQTILRTLTGIKATLCLPVKDNGSPPI